MAPKRSTLKDVDQLTELVKHNLAADPAESKLSWQIEDLDLVVGFYEKFLVAVASTGHTLGKDEFVAALKKQFEADTKTLTAFARKMQLAISHCLQKSKSVRSGHKTAAPVLRVIKAFQSADACDAPKAVEPKAIDDSSDDMEELLSHGEAGVDFVFQDLPAGSSEDAAARVALAKAKAMFSGGGDKTLKRESSVVSVTSDAEEAIKEPVPKDRKLEVMGYIHIYMYI